MAHTDGFEAGAEDGSVPCMCDPPMFGQLGSSAFGLDGLEGVVVEGVVGFGACADAAAIDTP